MWCENILEDDSKLIDEHKYEAAFKCRKSIQTQINRAFQMALFCSSLYSRRLASLSTSYLSSSSWLDIGQQQSAYCSELYGAGKMQTFESVFSLQLICVSIGKMCSFVFGEPKSIKSPRGLYRTHASINKLGQIHDKVDLSAVLSKWKS